MEFGDITFRAVDALKNANKILAEYTRTTGVLLNHYEISTPCESFHIHNEHYKLPKFIEDLKQGSILAQVSDAGMPAISDPGYLLARAAIEESIDIEVLPGATAFLPALIKSGFSLHKFTFEGFLPKKKGRQTKLQECVRMILWYFMRPPTVKNLNALLEYCGENRREVFQENTKKLKKHSGRLIDVLSHFELKSLKENLLKL